MVIAFQKIKHCNKCLARLQYIHGPISKIANPCSKLQLQAAYGNNVSFIPLTNKSKKREKTS